MNGWMDEWYLVGLLIDGLVLDSIERKRRKGKGKETGFRNGLV